eukprot:FR740227.1.p1 GENE.FR740227.1~~FR740227.1.p1  ORF type:complete len:104 (+),score=3.33 FR740227.1:155-466(+)
MSSALQEKNVNYALLRVEKGALTSRGIKSETERYIFIQWMPPGCSPMLRGAVHSHRKPVRDIFTPFQVKMSAQTLDEPSHGVVLSISPAHNVLPNDHVGSLLT